MNRTIFSPSFGNRPSFLVGREGVLDILQQGLLSEPGSRERSVVMLGSGERLISKRNVPRIDAAQVGALGFTVGLEFSRDVQETKSFQFKLTRLARELSSRGHGMLILIDELQANSPEVRQLVTAYQELVGEGLNVAMVLAGLPGAVSATLNDRVLTLLNRSRKVRLDPLRIGDVRAFYESAFPKLGIEADGDAVSYLADCTQGSPSRCGCNRSCGPWVRGVCRSVFA